MTADEKLALIRIKVERARKHILDLNFEVKAFLERYPYQVGVKRHPETQQLVYYLLSVLEPPPVIAAITGDILQNLRSALDHLAYHLVVIGTGRKEPFTHVYFPISENATKYQQEKATKVKGMHPDALKAIDAVKPYGGENDMLWWLHKLNNIDKHRLLITVGSAYHSVNVGPIMHQGAIRAWKDAGFDDTIELPLLDLFLKPADRMFPLKVGDELFIDESGTSVNEQIQFRFEIAFGEPQLVEGKPLTQTLQQMIDLVDNTILGFKPLLT